MRIKPKFARLFGLTAAAALLAMAVGASAYASAGFKTHSGTFPVEFLGEGGAYRFESAGKDTVTCENSHSKGSIVSSTLAKVTITYLNKCELKGIISETCPTITTKELLITPLDALNGGAKLGWLFVPRSGTELANFTCTGSGKTNVKITKAVVCESTPGGVMVTKGQVICRKGSSAGEQQFTSGTSPTGAVLVGTLTAEATLGFFKITEKDSQETTENVTYKEAVEQNPETIEPLPNETTIEGFGKVTEGKKEVPVINWGYEAPIKTKGCKGGKVVVSVEAENTETHKLEHREVTLTENPPGSGKFSGNIPVMKPLHGLSTLKITVSGCEHSSEEITVEIMCYIDPSGTVVDGNHEDAPVGEATVTLLSSPTETGTYTAVESGSIVMSEMNRVNPDSTRENGGFGWETTEGWYKVDATKTGCGSGSTAAFHVPPPQEKLLITLHCEGEQWKVGEEGAEKPQLAVTAPTKTCEGDVRVENVSFGTALITVLKETGIECTIKKKGCEAKKLNKAEKCESELEKPGTKPEYELEVEWKGKKFTRKFPV
jgi:hypothetical protein